MSYEKNDILVRIRGKKDATGTYRVEATLGDGSFYDGGELRIDMQDLLTVQLDVETYGLDLFDALFAGPIRRAYDKITGLAEVETEGRLRVRLWIDDEAVELHALPWERLYHIHKGQAVPLAVSMLTPFSRYTGLEIAEPEPIRERPIRILVAIANPKDLPDGLYAVNVEQEVESLFTALGRLGRQSQVQITLMPGRTGLSVELREMLHNEGFQVEDGPTRLENIVRLLPGYHVFHFLGHGHFRRRGDGGMGTAALYLEKADGTWDAVKDEDIVIKLAAITPLPHLAFLSACESAKRNAQAEHPFVGLAPKLVKAGLPAVVAMQESVPMDLARELTADFYSNLLEHGYIDRALNQARLLLFDQEQVDWAIPVLFMRIKNGQLFSSDPVLTALRAMQTDRGRYFSSDEVYLPLPLEVAHVVGTQDYGSLEHLVRNSDSSLDFIETTLGIFTRRDQSSLRGPAHFVILIGGHGTAKSTQLRRIASITVDDSLCPNAEWQVIPVYLNLTEFPIRRGTQKSIETLVLDNLKPFWPDLTAEKLSDLFDADRGPFFRILIDGSDDLPEIERREAWRVIKQFVSNYTRHEYMLAVDPIYFDPRRMDKASDLLVVQPLSRRIIRQFLETLKDPTGSRLYSALKKNQLFDLAAIPWLMVSMFNRAQRGIYPRSRSEVLRSLVEDALAEIPSKRGMRSGAEKTLYTLAWEMQSARQSTRMMKEAFHTAATLRGNREYSLEDLFDALVKCGLLAWVGPDAVRFAYPAIQAYGAARAILAKEDHDRVIDDITASLGRLTRLRWWEDTLVLLCGLMRKPNVVLQSIIYGVTLTEGQQIFLAVRCILEASRQSVDSDLLDQVVDALVWLLESSNEHRVHRRVLAAQALGVLWEPAAISQLARVANQPVRTNWKGIEDYEFSSVRMAATMALQRMMPKFSEDIAAIDPKLAEILRLWQEREVYALAKRLRAGDVTTQALAAFAVGDLQTPEAVDILIGVFLDPKTAGETRWAVTDAMILLDPVLVTRRAILPLLDFEAAQQVNLSPRVWKNRARWYERLAYLIGKIRSQETTTMEFLGSCLYKFKGIGLKAKAIRSIGELYYYNYKELFEDISLGKFQKIAVSEALTHQDTIYLRRVAIETLANIGDEKTLSRLREDRTDWTPAFNQVFYRTSEEILWRSSFAVIRK